ncbi:hypothetical protein QQX09_10190 [Demequina sp. SYSU T00192]|uniref:Uncharacterized protein n=1 Tax=Demequina litoralis TaxID=3051660 RepID=A0ABT8GAR6_9MICO|nr:hypothetical protein [Demequina sp. SYSU T00192]MDN4476223.1 hypothetical protein [Demequina sp. SYSU T00192]
MRRAAAANMWSNTWAIIAIVLAVLALTLVVWNPRIGGTSYGDSYRCLAPWDTVLNGAFNTPGGDPPPDALDVAARCRTAGSLAFAGAAAAAAGAAASLMAAMTLRVAGHGRAARHATRRTKTRTPAESGT